MKRKNPQSLPRRSCTWLLRSVVLPLGDLAMGHPMMRRLKLLEQAQWWEPERLQAERERSLAELIRTAYAEVPLYRQMMDRAELKPEDIRRPRDLPRLPIATKSLLREGYPHLTCRDTGQRTYEASTSGSTGTNFRVREDNATAGWYRASMMLALEWTGWHIGEPHLQTGMTLQRGMAKKWKDVMLGCHYVSAFDLSDARLDENLELLDRHQIGFLWGYPGSIYYLARRAQEEGWNRPLNAVATWGDNLFPHYRQTIESAFKTRVFDTYGCGEGIQMSAQCGEGQTYHVHSLDVVVEIVDDQGQPVPAGQPGNIVLTRLHAGPMPLIRYQIGDVGALAESGARPCACGRGFEMMSAPQGRNTDVVITPAGNRLIVHFFTGVLEFFKEIDCFQVVQETAEDLVIHIQPTPLFGPQSRERIIAALEAKGMKGMKVQIELVDEIPLTAGGKRRFVINKTLRAPAAGAAVGKGVAGTAS